MFVDKIPESQLSQWLWWLTFAAIILPVIAGIIVGGFAYAAMKVNDRISDITERDRNTLTQKVSQTTDLLTLAQKEAAEANE